MEISIIIPNYNKESFIGQTLLSLKKQTYNTWEAIIVDDNSSDKSIEIIESIKSEDNRFKLIKTQSSGKGASVCRNLGLKVAQGKYIIFLDSDDLLAPTCLEYRIQYLKQNDDLDFAVFPMQTFKNKINEPIHVWHPGKVKNHLLAFLQHQLPWQTMCPTWKREFLNKIGGFDPGFKRYDDVELHTRALLIPGVKYLAPRNVTPDCYYFIGQDRMTFNFISILERVFSDTKKYILTVSKILKEQNKDDSLYLKYLKGTIFVFFKQLFIYYQKGEISSSTKDFFIDQMKNADEIKGFLTRNDLAFLSAYCKGASITKGKIKGYNFLMKKIFIHLI